MAMFFILLVLVLSLCGIQYALFYTKKSRIFNKIPGPKKYPIIGNLLDFLYEGEKLFYQSRKFANDFKNIYSIQIFHNCAVNIYNPQDLEVILSSSKHITKSLVYLLMRPWLGEGLLTSNGEKWHKRRKILTPAFHFNILRQFCKVFDEQSKILVEKLKVETNNNKTNIVPYITNFTLNSICETAMGTQTGSNDNSTLMRYKKSIYDIGSIIVTRITRLWLHSKQIFALTTLGRKQKRVLADLHAFTLSIIRSRRKTFKPENSIVEDIENDTFMSSTKRRLAMLDLLLEAETGEQINEEGIREEVDTFMFEGHDTTTMGISFCLMLLANHKSVQEKVNAELWNIFENSDRPTTIDDLNKMKYLDMVIKEGHRLFPPVPFISRELLEDVELSNYLVPAGTLCHIHIIDMHRDATLFPCPDDFIPERFTPDNISKRHPFAFVPFSAGPRNCIGQKFALLEEKCVLSYIVRNYILEPVTTPKDIVFTSDLVLRSKNPIYIKFIKK